MHKLVNYWFISLFALTLLFPLYGKYLDSKILLNGVIYSPKSINANINNLNNGTYQTFLMDSWDNNFPGRKILLKLRNQILYSVFKDSPNTNVVLGKDEYLFEPLYILFELQVNPPSSDDYFAKLGNNLLKLKDLLEKNDKELFVFITPSKARFCKEYIPNKYMYLKKGLLEQTNYSKLKKVLTENGIKYYDSIQFIDENLDKKKYYRSPLFYKSGIHWSHAWGKNAAADFLRYINEHSKFDLSLVDVSENDSKNPIWPDTDLYLSLNLFTKANEKWYSTVTKVIHKGKDCPNVFLRGGSFMGQSLNGLIEAKVFNKDVHFENNYYHVDRYTQSKTLTSYNSYEQINLDRLIGQSDILILEVNEASIPDMGWGFIEYLLKHPLYLDNNY